MCAWLADESHCKSPRLPLTSRKTSGCLAAGCLNGGGQPKPTAKQTPAQLLEQLEELYAAGGIAARPEADPALQQLYMSFVQGEPGSQAAHQLMHTHYHKRDKTVTATLADW